MAQNALDVALDRDSDVPLGTQLAWKLRGAIAAGRLRPGDRLPGVRDLAATAGVNVNTVRAVYERLEGEGFVVTQHGRGSFVAENVPQVDPRAVAARAFAGGGAAEEPTREELKEQIAALEGHLGTRAAKPPRKGRPRAPRVLTDAELAEVRDELVTRLEALDAVRDELVDLLASLRIAMGEDAAPASPAGTGAPAARPDAAPRAAS